jgi:hypothetical protein
MALCRFASRRFIAMRMICLALVAIRFAFGDFALAQDSHDPNHSISAKLPLFAENHCAEHKNPANQLFCGDPELNAIGAKLASASRSGSIGWPTGASRTRKTPNGSGIVQQTVRTRALE